MDLLVARHLVSKVDEAKTALSGVSLTGLEVLAINGNTIVLTSSIAAHDTDYKYGVVEITESDTALYCRNLIMSAIGNTIVMARPFLPGMTPAVGDTLKIYGGPLSVAATYVGEPESFESELANGIEHFITISPEEGAYRPRTGSHVRGDQLNTTMEFGFQATAEVIHKTGTSTAEDTKDALYDVYTLRDQLLAVLHWERTSGAARIRGLGDISWVHVLWERAGDKLYHAAVIQFDMACT